MYDAEEWKCGCTANQYGSSHVLETRSVRHCRRWLWALELLPGQFDLHVVVCRPWQEDRIRLRPFAEQLRARTPGAVEVWIEQKNWPAIEDKQSRLDWTLRTIKGS